MSDYTPPEKIHSPGIRKAIRPLAEAIQKESGASRVIIVATYELNAAEEKLSIKMQVSTDNCMERTDSQAPRPKGDKLALDAEAGVRDVLKQWPKEKGGE